MSQRNRQLARLYFERFPHDESLVEEVLGSDFVMHHLRVVEGPDAFRTFMRGVSRAFPDFRFDVHHVMAENDLVAAHYTFAGTQEDTFLGSVPSLGRSFSARGMSLFRCSGERIAEIWVTFNTLSMMQQLGAVGEIGDGI